MSKQLMKNWIIAAGMTAMASFSALFLAACNDSGSLYGTLTQPLAVVNNDTPDGPFPGCVSTETLGTSRIRVHFAFPPGSTKMVIYRNGKMIGSSTILAVTSIDDEELAEGHTYLYTCEALINAQYKMGTNAVQGSTLSVNAPIFPGIATASARDSSSVTITWLPADEKNGVIPAYYNIYYNLPYKVNGVVKNDVNWSATPKIKITSISTFSRVIMGLGDELTYYFGVRACSATDVCSTNMEMKSVTLPDGGAPRTPGATGISMSNGQASILAPWEESNGAVSKRNIYRSTVDGSNLSTYELALSYEVPELFNPPTTLLVPGLLENTTYYFIVQDLDPSSHSNANTSVVQVATGDMTAPMFAGVTSFVSTLPTETAAQIGWTAIDAQDQTHPNGASRYLIYRTEASYPFDSANNVLDPPTVPDPCATETALLAVPAANYTGGNEVTLPFTDLKPRTSYWICVKAQDEASNISNTTTYLRVITQDTTKPAFDGLQTIAYNREMQRVDLTWNSSQATDLVKYSINLWKLDSNGNKTAQTTLDVPATAAKNIASYNFNSNVYTYEDGDVIYSQVVACDNANILPGGNQNCSNATAAKSVLIPHINPPKGFTGIAGLNSNAEGVLNVSWYPPSSAGVNALTGAWNNYAGFRVYSVENSALVYLKDCPCPLNSCTNASPYTSCDVATGHAFRTYTIYVAAYDVWGNYTSTLPELTPSPANEASKRTLDATVPDFSGAVSQDVFSDTSGVKLSWAAATDNQYAQEPGAQITYRIYRKTTPFTTAAPWTSTTPFVPKLDAGATLATATPLTTTSFTDKYQISGVDNLVQGSTYYWVICAFDASGNSMCNPTVQSYDIKDRTVPVIGSLTATAPSPTWSVNWNMTDNLSNPTAIKAILRLRISTVGPDDHPSAAPFALGNGDLTVMSLYGSDAGTAQNFSAVNGDLTGNIYTLSNQQGTPGQNLYYNYALTVVDEAPNYSVGSYVSVYSKLAPPLPATELEWQGKLLVKSAPFTASWKKSADSDYASQKIVRYSTSNANLPACSGSATASAATSTGITCDGDLCTYTVSSVPGDGYFSFEIITTDTYGNTSKACSNKLQVDSVRPAILDVMALGPNNKIYTTGNSFFIQVTFSKPVLVTGSGATSPQIQLYTTSVVPLPIPFTDGWAVYYPGGGGSTSSSPLILFQYTVLAGDATPTLGPDHLQYIANSLSLNGGTILDEAGNSADLTTLPAPANATLYKTQNITIDTNTPSITITAPTTNLKPAYLNLSNNPMSYNVSGVCSANALAITIYLDDVWQAATTCGADLKWSASLNVAALPPGPHQIKASIKNGIGVEGDDTIIVNAGSPSAVSPISGNNPSGIVAGSQVATPFVARVTDANGIGVPSVSVNWAIVSGGGTLSATTTTTDASGYATSPVLTTGTTAGANLVSATIASTAIQTQFTVTTVPGSPTQLAITSQPSSGAEITAGSAIPMAVEIRDINNNKVTTNATLTVNFANNPNSAGHLSGNSITTSTGAGTFGSLSIEKVNPSGNLYTLRVTATLSPSGQVLTSEVTNSFNIVHGPASALVFTNQPALGAFIKAGANIPASVEIQDSSGNTVTDAINSVSLAIMKSTGSQLGSSKVQTPVSGTATYSDVSITAVANGYTLQASATLSGAGVTITSRSFNISPADPDHLDFSAAPGVNGATAVFKAGVTIPITIQIQDSYHNVVTSASSPVSIAIQSNPTTGVLANATSLTPINGEVSFTGLSINKAGSPYILRVSTTIGGNTKYIDTSGISIVAGDPAKLAFGTEPAPGTVTAGNAVSVSVQIQDASGNVVTNATDGISLALINPAGVTTSTLGPVTPVSGASAFTPTIYKAGQGWTLSAAATFAASGTSVSKTSSTFTVVAAAPAKVSFVTQPEINASITGGSTIPFVVEVRDTYDNAVLAGGTQVTLSIATPNTAGGTLSGAISKTSELGSGQATFSNVSLDKAGTYNIKATASTFSTTSNTFSITAGPPSKIGFKVQPNANYTAGQTISVTVQLQDAGGNAATGSGTISLSLVDSVNNSTSLGSMAVTNSEAAFSISPATYVAITKKGAYTLSAAASDFGVSLTNATSNAFNINASTPVGLEITSPDNSKPIAASVCFSKAFTLTLKDAYGNAATWSSTTTYIPLSTSSSNGTGSAQFYSNSNCASLLYKPSTNYVATFTNGAASATFYAKYNTLQSGENFTISADGSSGTIGLDRKTSSEFTVTRKVVYYPLATPADQTFIVPAGSTSLRIKAWGAGGGSGSYNMYGNKIANPGGGGAFVHAMNIPVTAGESLTVTVSKGGEYYTMRGDNLNGASGGLAAVFRSATPLIVAGGGGAGGALNPNGAGGAAGGVTSAGLSAGANSASGAQGATHAGPGQSPCVAVPYKGCYMSSSSPYTCYGYGGGCSKGGGAGYYGGSGGTASGMYWNYGGGGGSSYFTGTWVASESGSGTAAGGTSDPDYLAYGSVSAQPAGAFHNIAEGTVAPYTGMAETRRAGDAMIVIEY